MLTVKTNHHSGSSQYDMAPKWEYLTVKMSALDLWLYLRKYATQSQISLSSGNLQA